mmetsp:Transcript_13553/g.34586  ORF Transcript_13553/g.34586 Transcript_13553/m.34586 type:complete len:203 (-) Transcript_13553:1011-1619(-)
MERNGSLPAATQLRPLRRALDDAARSILKGPHPGPALSCRITPSHTHSKHPSPLYPTRPSLAHSKHPTVAQSTSSTMPCFFLPDEILSSRESSAKSATLTSSAASSILASLSRAPPPETSRFTSPLDLPNSSRMNRSITCSPPSTSAALTITRGSADVSVAAAFPLKRAAAVSRIVSRQPAPCSIRVASSARIALASLIDAP